MKKGALDKANGSTLEEFAGWVMRIQVKGTNIKRDE